jgi:hypothetical protein
MDSECDTVYIGPLESFHLLVGNGMIRKYYSIIDRVIAGIPRDVQTIL